MLQIYPMSTSPLKGLASEPSPTASGSTPAARRLDTLHRLLDAIERAGDAAAALSEHVRVHHGRAHVLVTEKFLNGPYVVARLQQVSGKGMAQRMAADGLGDAGRTRGRGDRARKNGLEHVMPADHARTRICRQLH